MFKEILAKAIERHVASETPRAKSATKGAITRIVDNSILPDTLEQTQEVLKIFDNLPDWIKNRFTPGSLYREGDAVFGWFYAEQRQAKPIPVDVPLCCEGYLKVLKTRDGFIESVPIPITTNGYVSVPVQDTFIYTKCGYAEACSLQWHRDSEGYKVNRSIIPHGFWQAWKWWDGAWQWYLEKRPELFEDFECWGELVPDPRIKPGSAVLGNRNKEFWESQKFHLE